MKENESKSNSWSFFINRRPVSWLVLFGILIAGFFSLQSIPREVQPEINIPIGIVSTVLPGGSPGDTESLITEPLEQEIAGISDISSLTSSSGLGVSSITVEFEAQADIDQRIQDLKDAVDLAKSELPEDATDPVIIRAEADSAAVVNFSISGPRTLDELTKVAEDLEEELKIIRGVSDVEIAGGQKRILQITLDQSKAEDLGIRVEQVAQLIQGANLNLPFGIITSDGINYSISANNTFKNIQEIRAVPITTLQDQTIIQLNDIATIEESLTNKQVISKLSVSGQESAETVTLQVFKKEGANILEVVDNAKAHIQEVKPNDIQIAVTNDFSEFIRTDLGILTDSGIQTTILIIIILFLALGLVEGILAGLSIPLTLLATIVVMNIQGLTINSLTLFSMVIALGLMVDTAIVVMEGIHENMREGKSSKQAAINSVETYKWPLIAGTMTTIFAFFPMLLVSGILGEFLKALPLTISAALFSSIFISLTIIPAIASKFLAKRKMKEKASILSPLFDWIGKYFRGFIKKVISKRFGRVATIFIALLAFAASMSLPITGALRVEMFPATDVRNFIISIEATNGLVMNETQQITERIEAELYEIPEIQNFLTIIGTGQSQVQTDLVSTSSGGSSNRANITVNLTPQEERERRSYEIAQEVRETLSNFREAKVQVQETSEGPPSDAPVTVRITGPGLEELKQIANDVEAIITEIDGTQNINQSITPGLNEFQFMMDRDILSFHGLNSSEVSLAVRNIIQGVDAGETKFNIEEELEIFVRYDLSRINGNPQISIKEIEQFKIRTPQGYFVEIGELGEFVFRDSVSSIAREEQERIIKVRADLAANVNAVEIGEEVQSMIDQYELPEGYNIRLGGDTEDIEESFQDLFRSMGIGLILITFTLVLMFNSLRQPLIILFTLPLALIGVFPGLMSIGLNLSFPAFLGVVALTGVVVNDAIVLIDRINQNRRNTENNFIDSITEAAQARLQPILMTTITTVVGILPLALTNEFWAGLGFSLVFGLLAATMLTLVVIPVLYYMFESRRAKKAGEF